MFILLFKIIKIAYVLLKIAVGIFVVINIMMKGKPFIAICLAIKDYIKSDKKAFKGYGFFAYVGFQGMGKTVSIVEYLMLLQRKYPKVKVYTNFKYKGRNGNLEKWQDVVETENYELKEISEEKYNMMKMDELDEDDVISFEGKYYEKVNNGIIFVLDEVHLTLASQTWKNAPDNLLETISQLRKNKVMILASSQVQTRMNIMLREQTNFVIECSAYFLGRLVTEKYYRTQTYIPPSERAGQKKRMKCVKRKSFVSYDIIRNNYSTRQVMKSLISQEAHESKLIEALRESLKI